MSNNTRLHSNQHVFDDNDNWQHGDCTCTNQDVYGNEGYLFTADTVSALREGYREGWTDENIDAIAELATDKAWLLSVHDGDGLWRCVAEAADELLVDNDGPI